MTTATWVPAPGYEGLYEVSDGGEVRSLDRVEPFGEGFHRLRKGRLLRARADKDGYQYVVLCKNNVAKHWRLARLVLTAFVGPGEGKEAGHKNHDTKNNALYNLEWVSRLENERQKDAAKRRPPVSWQILTAEKVAEARDLYATGKTQREIGVIFGCHHSTVSLAFKRCA